MITRIEIDGFKSLRNFSMDFRPGLNVLAGPNGSGKTNILQALELLQILFVNKHNTALEQAINKFGDFFSRNKPSIKYVINIIVKDNVSFRIEVNFDQFSTNSGIGIYNDGNLEKYYNGTEISEIIIPVWKNETYGGYLVFELGDFHIFDIEPSIAALPSKKIVTPYLHKDGANLSRVIQHYTQIDIEDDNSLKSTDTLLELFNLLPISIKQIKVETRPGTPDVEIDLGLEESGHIQPYSLKLLSAGTVAWVAICTCITVYNSSSLAFDEPDRHLHPDMIRTMVSLFREHAENGPGWLLLTTHNETLLNQCRVDEVQLVSLNEEGFTQVKPIEDQEGLKERIYESGHQIGWYYVHNAL